MIYSMLAIAHSAQLEAVLYQAMVQVLSKTLQKEWQRMIFWTLAVTVIICGFATEDEANDSRKYVPKRHRLRYRAMKDLIGKCGVHVITFLETATARWGPR
jgi:hypothetical protein